MPKSYTIIRGDTLTAIAVKFYGDGTKYKEIADANPSITDPNLIITGDVITIPDLVPAEPAEPAEIDVTPETIIDGKSEEIGILINGQIFKYWTNATITRSFDSIADSFSLSVPWFPDKEEYREAFKRFAYTPVVLYIGGEKILTGNIITIRTTTGPDARVLTIEGYSSPGVIADVNVSSSSWPVSIDGLNLKKIAEKITKPFSLKVIFEDDPGGPFTGNEKQVIEPDEKIGDYLIKLARQKGFVIASNPDGNLLFRKTTTESASVSILEGEPPYLGSSVIFNGQNRFSDLTAIGTEMKRGAGQIAVVSDPELKANGINRPFVFKATDTNAGGLKGAATAKLGRQIADSIKVDINVKGFHDPDGFLWADDTIIVYQSDGDMIYEPTEFLIRNVKFNKSPGGATTDLSLVLPAAYL